MNESESNNKLMTFNDMRSLAESATKSGMFGIKNVDQALCLFALCQAEGLNPIAALRRYHIIDGKPSMRADAMLAEFAANGGSVMWHQRHDAECAATFFVTKPDEKACERAKDRYAAMFKGDTKTVSELAYPGEETIIRTIEDARAKRVCMAWDAEKKEWRMKHVWQANPRQMLTARVITEGVRLVAPGIITGIYAPEELEDAREAFALEAGAPPARDRAAIEALIAQHQQNALEAAHPEERRRLLGLAADLKIELEKLPDGRTVAWENRDTSGDTKETYVEKPALPAKEAKVDQVIPPDKSSNLKISDPEPEKPVEEEPYPTNPRDYKIRHVKSKSYLGRPLGSFTKEELEVLYKKRALPYLDSEDEGLKVEAMFIKAMYTGSTK